MDKMEEMCGMMKEMMGKIDMMMSKIGMEDKDDEGEMPEQDLKNKMSKKPMY